MPNYTADLLDCLNNNSCNSLEENMKHLKENSKTIWFNCKVFILFIFIKK